MENTTFYPLTAQEKQLNKKVKEYKYILPSILVSPFNKNKWSKL